MHKSFGNTANVDFAQISQLRIFEKHKFDFEEKVFFQFLNFKFDLTVPETCVDVHVAP